jgi:predicted nucleic acid-binding protein
MRILLDTDVVLDLLLKREPYDKEAEKLFLLGADNSVELYVNSITPINVFYIGRKLKGREAASDAVQRLLALVQVAVVDSFVLSDAFSFGLTDFEDAVQCSAAISEGLDAVVTRNLEDYTGAPIQVLAPGELLDSLEQGRIPLQGNESD